MGLQSDLNLRVFILIELVSQLAPPYLATLLNANSCRESKRTIERLRVTSFSLGWPYFQVAKTIAICMATEQTLY